jgi:hypothetical protein
MAAAVGLRAEGLSLRQIGDRLACSHQTVVRDLARWDQEHQNVVPLSHLPVTNSPRGGEDVTPECDTQSNVIELRLATRRHA